KHDARATFFAVAENARTGELLWHDRLAYAAARTFPTREAVGERMKRFLSVALVDALIDPAESSSPAHALVRCAKRLAAADRARLEQSLTADTAAASPAWEGMMNFAQLSTLADDGHEIGSHSMTH